MQEGVDYGVKCRIAHGQPLEIETRVHDGLGWGKPVVLGDDVEDEEWSPAYDV